MEEMTEDPVPKRPRSVKSSAEDTPAVMTYEQLQARNIWERKEKFRKMNWPLGRRNRSRMLRHVRLRSGHKRIFLVFLTTYKVPHRNKPFAPPVALTESNNFGGLILSQITTTASNLLRWSGSLLLDTFVRALWGREHILDCFMIPGHCQDLLTKTLIVCVCRNHTFFNYCEKLND